MFLASFNMIYSISERHKHASSKLSETDNSFAPNTSTTAYSTYPINNVIYKYRTAQN